MRKFVLALAVAASVLTGCEFTTQDASQPNVIGPLVRVEASGCPGGPIFVAGARKARASLEGCGTRGDARRARAAQIPDFPGWQLLVAYLVPAAADAPDTVDVAGSLDETLQRSESYEDGLDAISPPPDGSRWVGYISDLLSSPLGAFTATADFRAPVIDGLAQGPFRYRVVSGSRILPESADDPVVCNDEAAEPVEGGALCLGSMLPGEGEPLAELPIRDLKVLAGETQPVEPGGTAQAPFTLRYAGPASPDADFAIAATSTVPGVQPLPDSTSVAPPSDSDTPLAVSVPVPAGTAPGDYDVTLTASLPNGQERSATARISVAAPTVPAPSTPAADASLLLSDPPHAVIIRVTDARLRGRTLFTGFVVRCPAALPVNCGGSGRAFGGNAAARTAQRRRSSIIGKSGLAVPSGGERELRVRLTPRGVRFLRDRRSVRLDVSATIRGRGGARVTTRRGAALQVRSGG